MKDLIYIVEDDYAIRELESYALTSSNFEVTAFEKSSDLYSALESNIPSLVILDIMLPDESGLETLKKLRSTPRYRNLPIIMVTAKTSELDAVKGLDMGADDYISKPFGVLELISRIKAVLRRSTGGSFDTIIFKNIIIDEAKHLTYFDNNTVELTYKEYEILKKLIINKNHVLTRDRLMESIWGYDFEQGNRTIDVHIQSLRKKLGEAGEYIKTVRNVGYKIGD